MSKRRKQLLLGFVVLLSLGLLTWVSLPREPRSPAPEIEKKTDPIARDKSVDTPSATLPQVERAQVEPAVSVSRSATILFVDELGSPVPDARLALVDNGIESAIGIADKNASLTLDAVRIEDKECLARADDHKPAWVHMPAHVENATIVLERLAGISGTVLLADGSHPDGVFQVIAYEDRCLPLCEEIARPSEAKLMRCTTTDSAGYFSITDLDPHKQYSLSGAGRGYVLDGPVEHILPGARDVQLTALPLYGIRLVITDNEGQPLNLSPNLLSQVGGGYELMDRTAKDCDLMNELVLAKIDGVECAEKGDHESIALIYSSHLEKENVGPIAVTINRPGYKRLIESVRAPRVKDALPVKELRLTPDPSERGSVRVQLKLAGPALACGGGVSLKGRKRNSDLFLSLPNISNESFTIDDVPCDEYTCVVRLLDGMLRIRETETGAPLMLSVLPNQTATLEVDLAKRSQVHVLLRDEYGLSYDGPLLFRVVEANGSVDHIQFQAAPYCLVGLKEGSVRICAMRGRSGPIAMGEEEFQVGLDLGPGEVREVVINSRLQKRAEVR